MTIDERLKRIKSKLEKGQEVKPVTVKKLLKWFEVEDRSKKNVKRVSELLSMNGIETIPHFGSADLNTEIVFHAKSESDKGNDNDSVAEDNTKHVLSFTTLFQTSLYTNLDFGNLSSLDDPTFIIGNLQSANIPLVSVKPESSLEEAVTKMIANDFSQLPVMHTNKKGLVGVISWRSIGTRLSMGAKSKTVKDLMEDKVLPLPSTTSLFKALSFIIENDYALIQNEKKEICGIVTASDLSLQFKKLTEPFLLVNEIEMHIRSILSKLPKEVIKNAKNPNHIERQVNKISDLTFGEYLRLLQEPENWKKFNFDVHKETFCGMIESVNSIRNRIMHFDPKGLDENSIELLRKVIRVFQFVRSIDLQINSFEESQ